MKEFNSFFLKVMPTNFKDSPISLRKAKILTYIHIFVGITVLILGLTSLFLHDDNPIPMLPALVILLALFYIFKKYGNLILSGNLLALTYAITVAPFVPETGGLVSDNLFWLIISPIIALLFANKLSGYIWIGILILFTLLLYYNDSSISKSIILSNKPEYYLISTSFLFIFIFGIVIIFETGQTLIIRMLNKQKEQLEAQKLEIMQKNEELEEMQLILRKTNAELENFAFAASHDLKEPLRMINMYTGLTQKRLAPYMDSSTKEFMGYVTGGISRMQTLLNDLLEYSRTGKKQSDIKEIDLNRILFLVVHNMLATMKDTEASITANKLPTVEASNTEMVQLFQNLIANAIKFRKTNILPEIKIYSQEEDDKYIIRLQDNGIGIKKEYHEKVFGIFERVHKKHEYEGSGIGLATCKKIVESTGGNIWLESQEGIGTTFYFTFPKLSSN